MIVAALPIARAYECGTVTFPAQRLTLLVYRLWTPGRADLATFVSTS
jgi:hypothetical protein